MKTPLLRSLDSHENFDRKEDQVMTDPLEEIKENKLEEVKSPEVVKHPGVDLRVLNPKYHA